MLNVDEHMNFTNRIQELVFDKKGNFSTFWTNSNLRFFYFFTKYPFSTNAYPVTLHINFYFQLFIHFRITPYTLTHFATSFLFIIDIQLLWCWYYYNLLSPFFFLRVKKPLHSVTFPFYYFCTSFFLNAFTLPIKCQLNHEF